MTSEIQENCGPCTIRLCSIAASCRSIDLDSTGTLPFQNTRQETGKFSKYRIQMKIWTPRKGKGQWTQLFPQHGATASSVLLQIVPAATLSCQTTPQHGHEAQLPWTSPPLTNDKKYSRPRRGKLQNNPYPWLITWYQNCNPWQKPQLQHKLIRPSQTWCPSLWELSNGWELQIQDPHMNPRNIRTLAEHSNWIPHGTSYVFTCSFSYCNSRYPWPWSPQNQN